MDNTIKTDYITLTKNEEQEYTISTEDNCTLTLNYIELLQLGTLIKRVVADV